MKRIFFVLFLLLSACFSSSESAQASDSPAFLNDLLRKVVQQPQFNMSYLRNGCFIRAHWIDFELARISGTPKKVFLQPAETGKKIHVTFANRKTFQWVFHVAAAHVDESSGETWVLDPLLSLKVLNLQEWLNLFQSQNPNLALKVQLTGPEVYHPDLEVAKEWDFESRKGPFSDQAMDYIRDEMARLFELQKYED